MVTVPTDPGRDNMSDTVVDRLRVELAEITDPRLRLARLAEGVDRIQRHLADLVVGYVALRREVIELARDTDPPLTWREIGEILGVTPQRAESMSKQQPRKDTR